MADAAQKLSQNFRVQADVMISLHQAANQKEEMVQDAGCVLEKLDPNISRVLVIGTAGIGKTSAMKGELVKGDVKNAKGAKSGAEAGTTEVEAPEKVKIWGTDTEFYCVDTPGMFQTSMIKNFMSGGSTESDFVLLCHDAANRASLENALQELFAENTISDFKDNRRFGVLYLRMNLAALCANMSGDDFSEEIVLKTSVAQMKKMLGDNYQIRDNIFFSWGSEAESKKQGKEHWAKKFAKWIQGEKFDKTIKVDTQEINKNPQKFMTKVVNQCEPEFQNQAREIIKKSFFSRYGCTIL